MRVWLWLRWWKGEGDTDADGDADVLEGVVGGWMGDLVDGYMFVGGLRRSWIDREQCVFAG